MMKENKITTKEHIKFLNSTFLVCNETMALFNW